MIFHFCLSCRSLSWKAKRYDYGYYSPLISVYHSVYENILLFIDISITKNVWYWQVDSMPVSWLSHCSLIVQDSMSDDIQALREMLHIGLFLNTSMWCFSYSPFFHAINWIRCSIFWWDLHILFWTVGGVGGKEVTSNKF